MQEGEKHAASQNVREDAPMARQNVTGVATHGSNDLSVLPRCVEAAPRFELGVGLLQSPALPLGYAAVLKF